LEVRGWKSEVGSQKLEVRGWMLDVGEKLITEKQSIVLLLRRIRGGC